MATWEGKPTLASVLKDYIPPTESALADPIKEHFRTLPAQLEANQAAMDKSMAGMFKTDMATGQPNPNYYPEAVNEMTQIMPGIMGATAFHGTPHKIVGKFDINKVGTGEGAQAYGHGMYFAENPSVAKEYQTVGGKGDYVKYGDKVVPTVSTEGQLLSDVTKLGRKAAINKYPDQADYIKTINPDNIKFEGGNLYKVDIPDEHIPNMLDWDKPYSQQPKGVKQLIDEAIQNENFDRFEHLALAGATKQHPRSKEYVPTGQEIMNDLSTLYGIERNSPEFSNLLQSKGIKGVSYLDADSRTGTIPSNGTRNFVVFDPSTVKILEENGKPLTRKELIEKELKKVVE